MLSDLQGMHDKPLICQWMQDDADSILRSCYLLCGDLRLAHRYAQSVFISAYETEPECSSPHLLLLEHMLRICPCRIILRAQHVDPTVARLMRLSPPVRKAAILCLYHGLDEKNAASLLNIPLPLLRSRLETAIRRLH